MAGKTYVAGPIRKILYSGEGVVITSGSALVLFSQKTTPYGRFTGMFANVGSLTVQYRMGVSSAGTSAASFYYGVNSSFVSNSGVTAFDVQNLGTWAEWKITAGNSQAVNTMLVVGEPPAR